MAAPPPKTQRQKAERETNSRRRLISAAIPADSPPTDQGPGKRKIRIVNSKLGTLRASRILG
jgi:hypothetical protein